MTIEKHLPLKMLFSEVISFYFLIPIIIITSIPLFVNRISEIESKKGENSMKKIVEHLIIDHNNKNLMFVGGLENHKDNIEREQVFKKSIEHYKKTIYAALEMGIHPRCHFEDITRADFYGLCKEIL